MRINTLIIFGTFLLLFSSASFAAPRSERFTLQNGMQVIAIPYGNVPAVTHMVWYKAGAKDEFEKQSGAAHFFEHMMFKGTEKTPSGKFSEIVARHGGTENAMTSRDYTAYFQNISKEHLELVMSLEADRMRNINFNDEDFAHEKSVVLEERSMRMENNPRARLSEKMNLALYSKQHPYGTPVIGWRKEIEALTAANLREFYDSYYSPNNAILIVAGNITADELRPLAEKYYGVIPSFPEIVKQKITAQKNPSPQEISLADSTVTKPEWMRFHLAPSATKDKSGYNYALSLLAQILGSGETGQLYKTLVNDKKIAIYASASYSAISHEQTTFNFHVFPKNVSSMEKIEKNIKDLIENIKKNGVTDEELQRAKTSIVAETIFAQDSFQHMAFVYGRALTSGLPAEYIENYINNIKHVTADEIQEAAKFVLKEETSVTGTLLPE